MNDKMKNNFNIQKWGGGTPLHRIILCVLSD